MRTALVTGASAGIGRAFARHLAAQGGHRLVLVARSAAVLDALAGELRDHHATEAEVVAADLTVPADRRRVIDRLTDPAAPVDLLVNAAGMGYSVPTTSNTFEREEYLLDINARSKLDLTLHALRAMGGRGSGEIVNVSSVAALGPAWLDSTYGASQAYLLAATESLAYSARVRRSGVRLMALLPGDTRTEFNARAGIPDSTTPAWRWLSAERLVRDALRDLRAGRVTSIPSRRYKVLAWALRHGPRSVAARVALDFGTLRPAPPITR